MELQVIFDGEIAQDAGGLSKEWYNILMKEMLADEFGVFVRTLTDRVAYIIPITSRPLELSVYEFAGRVLAKALFDNIPIYCPLSRVLYKHLLNHEIVPDDLQFVDDSVSFT